MVVNGQVANQTTFNNAFLSRTSSATSTVAILSLLNTAIASGASVNNVQALLNKIIEGLGTTGETDTNINNYASNFYVVDGQSRKAAIETLDTQLKATQDEVDVHETRLDGLDVEVNLIENLDSTFAGNKTFSNDVVVHGNFQVNGTTTFVNSTNLEVTDKNILVNKNGNDASADGAGIDVQRTSDNGALRYDSTLASKWKLGNVSAMYEVLVSGIAQTIAGVKTFLADVIIKTLIEFDGATSGFVKMQAPATPTSWTMTLPPTSGTSGQVLQTDGAGVTTWVTPSAGGETNTASNVGTGAGVYRSKTGVNLDLRSLKNLDGKLTITQNADDISIQADNILGNSYTPTSNFATGIPAASVKQIFTANYIRIGSIVMVWGHAYFRNDGSSVNITWSVPVTNGNDITSVSGSMGRMNASGEASGAISRLNAIASNVTPSTHIKFDNTGINTTASDAFWQYHFTYVLA